ncbi:hypothetical protein BDV3_001682 [Batrachochytrium dendrobatidis]
MTSPTATSTSEPCLVQDTLSLSGLDIQIQNVIAALLDCTPSDPISFISDYFFHAAHGSATMLRAYRLICQTNWAKSTAISNIGRAFEILITPGLGLGAKDCREFLSFFCCRSTCISTGDIESIRYSLAKWTVSYLDKGQMVTLGDFIVLVVYHTFIQDFLCKIKQELKTYHPQQTISRNAILDIMEDVFRIEQRDALFETRYDLYLAISQSFDLSAQHNQASNISFEEVLAEVECAIQHMQ